MIRRDVLWKLTMSGCFMRGAFPKGHEWRINVVVALDGELVTAVLFEGKCTCRRKVEALLGPPYCHGLFDPSASHKMLDALFADLYDEHFQVKGPSIYEN